MPLDLFCTKSCRKSKPRKSERCVEIKLTQAQYKKMVNEIKQSFQTSNDSAMGLKPKLIETAANYGTSDCFYEAEGKYSLFKTCNVWTNNTLKVSGLKAAFWAPFSDEVMEIHKLKE